MMTHLLPCFLWHLMRRRSSSLLQEFLRTFGSSLLCHLSNAEFYLKNCYLTFHDIVSRFLIRPGPYCWVYRRCMTSAWSRLPAQTSTKTCPPKGKVTTQKTHPPSPAKAVFLVRILSWTGASLSRLLPLKVVLTRILYIFLLVEWNFRVRLDLHSWYGGEGAEKTRVFLLLFVILL